MYVCVRVFNYNLNLKAIVFNTYHAKANEKKRESQILWKVGFYIWAKIDYTNLYFCQKKFNLFYLYF